MYNIICRPLRLSIAGFLCLILALQSCNSGEPGFWKNNEIESGKREDFHELNSQLLAALKVNKPKQMDNIVSSELLDNAYLNRQAYLISLQMKDDEYNLLNEFYIVHERRGQHSIKEKLNGYNYSLNYDAEQKEVYIACFIPQKAQNKWMITAVYGKYSYGWKLSILEFEPYTENGKTAPELFEIAKAKYAKHQLVDALNIAALAKNCSRPSSMWRYEIEEYIQELYGKAMSEANKTYKFPYTIAQVPTRPKIFSVFNQTYNGGSYPTVYYLSSVNVNDTIAIKRENESVQKVIGQVFPGIDQDKKYVIYRAYNQLPNAKKSPSSFEMVDKVGAR